MRAPRVHYSDQHGWLVDTQFPMTRLMLQACVDFTTKVQKQRISNMFIGMQRDRAAAALKKLSVETIQQNLQPMNAWDQERTAFAADRGESPNKIYIGA
jgi:beta-phosphoglucomutase-like phosphatase (HAD superfamily)